MNNLSPRNGSPPFDAWLAPAVDPSFRAAVWQRIEARRPAPRWSGAWWTARVGYAGALTATAMLWMLVLRVEPAAASRGFLAASPSGSLTSAFAQAARGHAP